MAIVWPVGLGWVLGMNIESVLFHLGDRFDQGMPGVPSIVHIGLCFMS